MRSRWLSPNWLGLIRPGRWRWCPRSRGRRRDCRGFGTLAGLDNNPAELVGYGPIPADIGRALAADAHWRRVLTDPETGTVLDLGHRRIPTPALARLVRHRQNSCLFPGCGMPAARADIDHTLAHAAGGRTALDNLGLLCRHHHRAKHSPAAGWRLEQPTPGVFRWTSPAGRTYITNTIANDEEALLPWEQPWRATTPRTGDPTVGTTTVGGPTGGSPQSSSESQDTEPCPF